jgi:hypothetical protein
LLRADRTLLPQFRCADRRSAACLEQRPAQREAAGRAQRRAPSSFIDRTASTGSRSTKRVFAHANGFFSVEENTTLDSSVSCAKLGSSDVAAKSDINRYVVAPIKAV